jgi:hypothetical protein
MAAHRFMSKAQWRWAFATKKTFARRWAHSTPSYQALPRNKAGGSTARTQAARIKSTLLGR